MSSPPSAQLLFNEIRFERMACGDLSGFFHLADEYFEDTRKRMSDWPRLFVERNFLRLSEDFHRCKGGAAMFGFERLYALFGSLELDSEVELDGSILERFASEVRDAENAVSVRRSKSTNA